MICGACKTRDVTRDHVADCYSNKNTVTVVAPDFEPVPITEGMYRNPQTTAIYKVQKAQESGNLYAKVLLLASDADGDACFEYERGAINRLRGEWKMTLAEAQQYGALYGTCVRCGKTLTDENSIAAGIGPVCAKKGSWA